MSPRDPTAPSILFTGYQAACTLNASEEDPHVEITVYLSPREPVSLSAHRFVSQPRPPNR